MDEVKTPKPKGRRYPWVEWFNKGEIKLCRYEHYDTLDHGFENTLRRAAKRHGYLISLNVNDGYITVKVKGRTEEHPEVHTNKYRKNKSNRYKI